MIKAVFLIASSLSLMAQAQNASDHRLVVYGGTVAAVEAALTARNAGAEVLLVTPRMYVGDDVVGTLSLVFDPSDVPSYDLEESEGRVPVVQTLFGTGPVTPLAAKQRLNELLARAGVERRFATVIRQVAHGKDGRLAAVELSDRSGCRFVPCSALVDATTFGSAAALAGAEFAPLQTGRLAFTRRVVAGEPPAADGLEVAETGLAYPASIRYMNGFWGDTFKGMQDRNLVFGNFTAKMYACRAEVELPDATPSAWARVDGIMRERCYTRRTLDWSADLSFAPVGPLTACGREGAEAFRAKAAPEVFALSVRAAAEPKLRGDVCPSTIADDRQLRRLCSRRRHGGRAGGDRCGAAGGADSACGGDGLAWRHDDRRAHRQLLVRQPLRLHDRSGHRRAQARLVLFRGEG